MNVSEMLDLSTSSYTVFYDELSIETTVTNESNTVEQWISSTNVKKQRVVGLDTEWMRVEKGKMKVAILQLCIENKCLIIQLFCMNKIPQSLRNFLMDSTLEFAGVGVMNDMNMLEKNYGLKCNKGIDVAVLAKKRWPNRISSASLKYLAKELLGLEMEKSKAVCTSDWKSKKLTETQVEYACIDAYVSYKIGKMIISDE
ncbi:unnamed protein product [Sphenostylis stenocarpa]|uniref:3'-5' exonuclease domain-containing protein n=1 Tax=Sphenostylis stenocarpa TaxID=92480 RepID=A0AA86RW41_9FABA|nr:unnamed protein product [Sphenostylis stenocarpa]